MEVLLAEPTLNDENAVPETDMPINAARHDLKKPPSAKAVLDEETLKMLNGGVLPGASVGSAADGGNETMQQRFARFKKERQRERKLQKAVSQQATLVVRDDAFRDQLREKFVNTCLQYLGIPYHPKYHQDPTSEFFQAPLYLDCCGLVRRALQDLAGDFNFKIGRWNQAYQFDTLGEEVAKEDLRPGDLIFVEGTYYNPKSRAQKYNIVHVEVFLGGGPTGEQTIGARHQRGVIKRHDSYTYTSPNYEITKLYFRSLEPWLRGELKPAHPEHWQARDNGVGIDVPGRRSVFGGDSDQEEGGDEGGDDGDHVGTNSNANTDGPNNGEAAPPEAEAATAAANTTDAAATVVSQGASTGAACSTSSSNGCSTTATATTKEEAPTFFAEKGNGYACVTSALRRRGWQVKAVGPSKGLSRQAVPGNHKSQKAQQQASASLQWVHATSSIDFDAHAQKALQNNDATAAAAEAPSKSVQLVNHIPNSHSVLTSKLGLLSTLKSHYGDAFPPPWFPETHSVSTSADVEQLLARNQELSAATSASPAEPIWMIKSSRCSNSSNGTRCGANKSVNFRSEGVQLVRGADALKAALTVALSGATKDHVETMAPLRSDIHPMPDSLPALDTMTGASAIIGTIFKKETEEEELAAAAADTSFPLGTPVRGSAVAAARKLAASPPTGDDDSENNTNAAYVAQLEGAAAEEGRGGDSAQLSTAPLPSTVVVQRYVSKPLLLLEEGFKFDLRVFFLVARCGPGTFQCMVYNRGLTRRALEPYARGSADLNLRTAHFANAATQKKHPDHATSGPDTLWAFEQLEVHLRTAAASGSHGGGSAAPDATHATSGEPDENAAETSGEQRVPEGWATQPNGLLQAQIKACMTACGAAAAPLLQRREGYFELMAADFVVDDQLKLHLLEVAAQPALNLENIALTESLLKPMVDAALGEVLKAHEHTHQAPTANKSAAADEMTQQEPTAGFELLVDEAKGYTWAPAS